MGVHLGDHFKRLNDLGVQQNLPEDVDLAKVRDVVREIGRSISEFNQMQFRGYQGADKLEVQKAIILQGNEVQSFSHLLKAKDANEFLELSEHIKGVFPQLSYHEAILVASNLHGMKIKLPPSSKEKFENALLTVPRVLYAVVTEVISALLAGVLGVLWKADLDPKNPILDRPPVLRVHGLSDTQGSSLPLWLMMRARRGLLNLLGGEKIKYGSGYSLSYAGLFYNNFKESIDDYVNSVADKVQKIRKSTGQKQIIMQGHSLGGLIINRFAQLQDVIRELKGIEDLEQREAKAKELKKALMIEPRICIEIRDLAKGEKGNHLLEKIPKSLDLKEMKNKIESIVENENEDMRKVEAEKLAEEVADAWWAELREKIDPDKGSMEAKWLMSICTPYDGSKFATGLNAFVGYLGIRPSRIISGLEKRSEISQIIAEDARKKVLLGERKVCNIACCMTDEFVSEGSATVNYDYRYTKVFKNLAHVGVLFSPRVAWTMGGWLDEIYRGV